MLVVVGCNHRSAPIALRERMAFDEADVPQALGRLLERSEVAEAAVPI